MGGGGQPPIRNQNSFFNKEEKMQNDLKRKNMNFVEKFGEIFSFVSVLRVICYSGSFDIHIEIFF